ncbi:mitochondrial amidoxime-reducing component 1-like isoform X1 [Dermacentor andersoni]|uniref:mitochondrial amidoxime-reducing component 1-like isoform X1 n=1 Tax=Dermacentor andersoni TaxID=34620 RepID=UPI002155CE69|nr:mitochondrial amidoxime-reducing component 1-like isoform X1 [Dermacentor andersoni]
MVYSTIRAPTLSAIALTATTVGGAVGVATYFWLKRKVRDSDNFVPVGHLTNIVIHPIKSIAGVEVPYADCTVAGPVYRGLKDRHMLVVKGDCFVSMREEPRLGKIRVDFDEDKLTLTLTVDGYPPLILDACDPEEHKKPSFTVRVRKFSYKANEVSEEASDWFRNYLKHDDVRLARVVLDRETIIPSKNGAAPVAFQDESSFHVLSKASLDGLLSKLPADSDIQQRNFRPTLFIDGCEAHAEDHWRRFRISGAEMEFLSRTPRCILTTVDQDTGIRTDKEPLVTLRKYRIDRTEEGVKKYELQPLFGVGALPIRDGRITVGDEVYALLSPNSLL